MRTLATGPLVDLSLAAGRRVGSFEGGGCVGADVDGVGDGSPRHPPAWVSSACRGKFFAQIGHAANLLPARGVTCADAPRDATPVSLRCPGGTAGDLRRFGMGLDALRPPTARMGCGQKEPRRASEVPLFGRRLARVSVLFEDSERQLVVAGPRGTISLRTAWDERGATDAGRGTRAMTGCSRASPRR